jgi:hypothetical protein
MERVNHFERLLDMLGYMLMLAMFFTILGTITSCGSAPQMEKPVSLYTGAPERGAICQIDDSSTYVDTIIPVNKFIMMSDLRCIASTSPEFAGYMAMSWDDAQMLLEYIENLKYSCVKWKKK